MSAINRKVFFDTVKTSLIGEHPTQSQVDGLTGLLDTWEAKYATKDRRWLAYALATVHHETAKKFQPIPESGGDHYFFCHYDIKGDNPKLAQRLGNVTPGDGVLFHGRGFVQLTGRANYADWQKRLGTDLTSCTAAADKVLDTTTASTILFEGMILGTFADKKLDDYIDGVRQDWVGARHIINGTDRAQKIADYAVLYDKALTAATGQASTA